MKAYEVFSRGVNAGTADGYTDWDDGIVYFAGSADEAEEIYIDDLIDSFGYDVRETGTNSFGNPVDFQCEDGSQFQIDVRDADLEDLTDEELAELIKGSNEWDYRACEELCGRAGFEGEWDDANGENFENVVEKAADSLGVEIY